MWKKRGDGCYSNTKLTRNNQSIIPYVNLIFDGIKFNGTKQNERSDIAISIFKSYPSIGFLVTIFDINFGYKY